jgi:(p)ppGpp synthase/HD superfamily hydrolase
MKNFEFSTEHVILIKAAMGFATKKHNDTNHMYGDVSYTIHLAHVVDVGYRFIDLIPVDDRPYVIAANWLHDTLEDVRISYNDLKKATNIIVAELVFAVTNEKGKTRQERANEKYYEGIRNVKYATFVKLCDRIANIEYSGKSDMYEKEHPHFKKQLYDEKYEVMFDYIEYLFEINKNNSKPN